MASYVQRQPDSPSTVLRKLPKSNSDVTSKIPVSFEKDLFEQEASLLIAKIINKSLDKESIEKSQNDLILKHSLTGDRIITLTEFINIAKLGQISDDDQRHKGAVIITDNVADGARRITKFFDHSAKYIETTTEKSESELIQSYEEVETWFKSNQKSSLDEFYASVGRLKLSDKMVETLSFKDQKFNREIYNFFSSNPTEDQISDKYMEVLRLNNLSKESQFRLEHRAYLEKQSVDEKIKQIIQKGNYGILETWANEDGVSNIKSYVKTTLQQNPQLIDLLYLDAGVETKEGDGTGLVSEPTKTERRGIQNLGNTCFFNATIQMLLSMPEVQMLKEQYDNSIPDLAVRNSLVRLRKAVETKNLEDSTDQAMNFRETCILAGIDIEKYRVERDADGPQQCANEILRQILDSLNLDTKVKLESTIRYFDGTSDEKSSTQVETTYIVDLPIKDQGSLKRAIASFQESETLTGEEKYEIVKGEKVDATKTTRLVEQQSTITFGLKRFEYKRSVGADGRVEYDQKKITDDVTIDESLTIGDKDYGLTSVLIHQGTTIRFGHYYTYRKEGKQWFQYNDSYVTEVKIEDVLADAKRGAYIVSYSPQNIPDAAE